MIKIGMEERDHPLTSGFLFCGLFLGEKNENLEKVTDLPQEVGFW